MKNWVERKSKNITEGGIFFAQIFFSFRFGTSYTTRGSQSLQSRYMGNDIDKVPEIRRTWLLFAPLLKRSQLWIQRLSSRLPTILSTAWKLTRQELWYALVLQTGSIKEIILKVSVLILVLVVFFSPGRRLWSSWTTAWPVAANSTGRTQMICSTGNAAKHLIILPISAWFVKSFDPHRKWTILTGAGSCGGRGSCSIGRRRSRWQYWMSRPWSRKLPGW